jgi:hypothetical protein
VHLLNLS